MHMLITVILCLILAFSPFLVYWCMKTKSRAMISLVVVMVIIDIFVLRALLK